MRKFITLIAQPPEQLRQITCIEPGRLKVELADNASYLMAEFSV